MSNLRNKTAATALQRGAAEGTTIQTEFGLSYPPPSTVKARFLRDLLAGRTITAKDCWLEHASNRLSHYVHVLRRDGWSVDTVNRTVPTSDGGRIAKIAFYSLPQDAIDLAGERGRRFVATVSSAKGGQ